MKAEINKMRKAIEIVENRENIDEKFIKATKRYEIKLKMELYETIAGYIDLITSSSE